MWWNAWTTEIYTQFVMHIWPSKCFNTRSFAYEWWRKFGNQFQHFRLSCIILFRRPLSMIPYYKLYWAIILRVFGWKSNEKRLNGHKNKSQVHMKLRASSSGLAVSIFQTVDLIYVLEKSKVKLFDWNKWLLTLVFWVANMHINPFHS